MLGPLHQNQHFLDGPTLPLSKLKFPPYGQNRRLSTQETFFLIAPGDLDYYWASAQPCAALRSLAHLTAPFLATGNAPKRGFFPKDRTYRAFFVFFHKRNFFLMVPKGLNAFGTFVHAAGSASLLF